MFQKPTLSFQLKFGWKASELPRATCTLLDVWNRDIIEKKNNFNLHCNIGLFAHMNMYLYYTIFSWVKRHDPKFRMVKTAQLRFCSYIVHLNSRVNRVWDCSCCLLNENKKYELPLMFKVKNDRVFVYKFCESIIMECIQSA